VPVLMLATRYRPNAGSFLAIARIAPLTAIVTLTRARSTGDPTARLRLPSPMPTPSLMGEQGHLGLHPTGTRGVVERLRLFKHCAQIAEALRVLASGLLVEIWLISAAHRAWDAGTRGRFLVPSSDGRDEVGGQEIPAGIAQQYRQIPEADAILQPKGRRLVADHPVIGFLAEGGFPPLKKQVLSLVEGGGQGPSQVVEAQSCSPAPNLASPAVCFVSTRFK
jgi:hypothetical protein